MLPLYFLLSSLTPGIQMFYQVKYKMVSQMEGESGDNMWEVQTADGMWNTV